MAEYLFLVFIAPIEWLMRSVLEWGFMQTGSYGFSIIIMSLVFNVVISPLYYFAERWQNAERAVQKRMASKLTKIKKVFSGQEQYALIKTLYRQNNYHPIFAVRTTFGFLIQIPFFFAAYQFLSTYAPLQGVSFLGISDLGQADALLHVAGLTINVLPFVMTAINILSIQIYTKRLAKRDKIQLYSFAALFLILLYAAPAGMLFYWTCNNVFSLLKNIIYEKMKISISTDNTQEKLSPIHMFEQFLGALSLPILAFVQNKLVKVRIYILALNEKTKIHPSFFWINVIIVDISIYLLIIINKNWTDDYLGVWTKYIWHWAPILICCMQFYWLYLLLVAWARKKIPLVLCILPVVLIFLNTKNTIMNIISLHIPMHFFALLSTTSLILVFIICLIKTKQLDLIIALKVPREIKQLFILSTLLLATFIFISVPTAVYFSDPNAFFENPSAIAAELTFYAFAFIMLLSSIFWIFRGVLRTLFVFFITYCALSAICYLYIFTIDYGVIDAFIFQFENKLSKHYYVFVDIIIASLILFAFTFCIKKNRLVIIKFVLFMFIAIALGSTLLQLINSHKATVKITELNQVANSSLPPYVNELFGFSPTGHNVVVIMLDMFTGDHLGKMLEEYPSLHSELDGFVWYPDTISESYATILSTPSMLGGHLAAPYQVNAVASNTSLEVIINKHVARMPALLAKHNFHSSIAGVDFLRESELLKYIPKENLLFLPPLSREIGKRFAQKYVSAGDNKWAANFLSSLSLFQIVPWSLHYEIYNKGLWFNTSHLGFVKHSVWNYAVLDMLSSMSNANSYKNTFKFITNELTHIPWNIDSKTLLPTAKDPYPATKGMRTKVDGIIPEHYYAEITSIKALLRWFSWMKQAHVYDNTQIIILSDHDQADSVSLAKAFGADISGHRPYEIGSTYPGRPHALLLVKDSNKRGILEESPQLMSTSDLMALVFNDIIPSLGLENDVKFDRPWELGALRVRYHVLGAVARARHEKNSFIIEELYKITGTMFDKDNWEKIDPDFLTK